MKATAQRRPIADRVTANEAWSDEHEEKCEKRMRRVDERLTALENTAGRTEGKVDLLVQAFIKEKEHPDGSKSVQWKLPKFSGKTLLGMVGSAGGIIVLLQLSFTMAVPALKAGFEYVMAYGH